ncbi:MAG: class I SAM-dependent methyltransferase [Chloroflexota bacterium]
MLFGTREPFDYLLCHDCGALTIRVVPADLDRHYPRAYHAGAGDIPERRRLGRMARQAERAAHAWRLFHRGRLVARLLRPWRPAMLQEVRLEADFVRRAGLRQFSDPILDVGCGRMPTRLARLRRVGFTNLTGIDPWLDGDASIDGIQLLRREIDDLEGQFQVVMFHHVFEHVADPEATLRAARRLLRPGGVVLIRTPVMGTWFWETYGRDWWELDPPRHLFVHSRRSLEMLIARVNLRIAEVIFDSTSVEIIASEQIRRNVAWREPQSWFVTPPAGFSDEDLARFLATTSELNRSERGGRAAFYLRRADDLDSAGPRA